MDHEELQKKLPKVSISIYKEHCKILDDLCKNYSVKMVEPEFFLSQFSGITQPLSLVTSLTKERKIVHTIVRATVID